MEELAVAAVRRRLPAFAAVDRREIRARPLTGGMSNVMFVVERPDHGGGTAEPTRVVARLLSSQLDAAIDRERENRIVSYISTKGIGARLFGTCTGVLPQPTAAGTSDVTAATSAGAGADHDVTFSIGALGDDAGGAEPPATSASPSLLSPGRRVAPPAPPRRVRIRLEEFLHGRTLSVDDLRHDPDVPALMAVKVARLHVQRPTLDETHLLRRSRGGSVVAASAAGNRRPSGSGDVRGTPPSGGSSGSGDAGSAPSGFRGNGGAKLLAQQSMFVATGTGGAGGDVPAPATPSSAPPPISSLAGDATALGETAPSSPLLSPVRIDAAAVIPPVADSAARVADVGHPSHSGDGGGGGTLAHVSSGGSLSSLLDASPHDAASGGAPHRRSSLGATDGHATAGMSPSQGLISSAASPVAVAPLPEHATPETELPLHLARYRAVMRDRADIQALASLDVARVAPHNAPALARRLHEEHRRLLALTCETALLMSYCDWDAEVEWLMELCRSYAGPVVLAHGDLQEGNWIRDDSGGSGEAPSDVAVRPSVAPDLHLIDYEYAGYNHRGHDLGNLFCEHTADYSLPREPGFTLQPFAYPSLHWQRAFLSAYLREMRMLGRAPVRLMPASSEGAGGDGGGVASLARGIASLPAPSPSSAGAAAPTSPSTGTGHAHAHSHPHLYPSPRLAVAAAAGSLLPSPSPADAAPAPPPAAHPSGKPPLHTSVTHSSTPPASSAGSPPSITAALLPHAAGGGGVPALLSCPTVTDPAHSLWLRTSISVRALEAAFPDAGDVPLRELAREARAGMLASHLYWSLWSAVMAAGKLPPATLDEVAARLLRASGEIIDESRHALGGGGGSSVPHPSSASAPPLTPVMSGHSTFNYAAYGLARAAEYVRLKAQVEAEGFGRGGGGKR